MATVQRIQVGPWELDVDLAATRELYAQISNGAEDCSCDHCQDWARERSKTLSPPIREFLATLGIDWRREAEVFEGDPRRASHTCAGWFHIVGRIVSGPREEIRKHFLGGAEILRPDTITITDGYDVLLHDGLPPMKPATEAALAQGLPIITLEFHTKRHQFAGGEDSTDEDEARRR